jgi:prepilin peptidase CpaA
MDTFAMDRSMLVGAALLAVLAVACWTDLTTRRIPNRVTVAGMLLGVALHAVHGLGGLTGSLLGVATALLLSVPFFAAGVIGGGDAKLLMAVGAFFGPVQFLWAALAIAVAGGILALGEAVRRGMLGPVLASCGRLLLGWATFGPRFGSTPALREPLAVPYGLAIGVGSAFWWFFGAGLL